jgi:ABC-type enterobactin transport system permease subunit
MWNPRRAYGAEHIGSEKIMVVDGLSVTLVLWVMMPRIVSKSALGTSKRQFLISGSLNMRTWGHFHDYSPRQGK